MIAGWLLGISIAGAQVVDDIVAEVVFDAPQVRIGEPVFFTFRVHNRGDVPLWRMVGGDYRNALGRASSYQCELQPAQGAALDVPDAGFNMGGIMHMAEIPPGGHTDQRLFLPNWGIPEAPGAHTLTCATELQLTHESDFDAPRTAVPVTVRADLTVLAADSDAMGALIEDLAAQAAGPDRDEALRQLARIEDARVIPFFVSQATGARAHTAIRALAKFDDDAALAGIVAAAATRAEDIEESSAAFAEQAAASRRLGAAQALSASAHPGAHAVLLSMAGHRDDNIRLTVVHALGRDKSPEASTMLQGFQDDASAMVAGEAARYLRER